MAKVCLDFGHGGSDAGACYGSRREKDDTLRIGLKVRDLLESYGVDVVCTRTTDTTVQLESRPALANSCKADYFLSIHRNAGGGTGTEIWVYSKATATNISNANSILTRVVAVAPTRNRGVKKGYTGQPNADYAVNRISTMSSALLELGFIDCDADNAQFDACLDQYGKAIAEGICEIVGVSPVVTAPQPTPDPAPSGKTHKVLTGESWWSIARDEMGSGTKYTELAAYNGMTIATTIHPGQVLKIPGGGEAPSPTMRVGAKVQYSGSLYGDSYGGGKGKTVSGTYTVSRIIDGRKCGVLLNSGLGWVPAGSCTVVG